MESIDNTEWDVLIAGTGRKVLHIDKNKYYGGSEAALSLQEAEDWADEFRESPGQEALFRNATITTPESTGSENDTSPGLSFSRAYSLALAPQLIYTLSPLLPVLVASKVERQLDFLAVGAWWVYAPQHEQQSAARTSGDLARIPNGREDVFADDTIDMRAKRSLMKFLRFMNSFEDDSDSWEDFKEIPFTDFLASRFNLPARVQETLLALTLSLEAPQNTTTAFALPRIARHLRSIGIFGPDFGAVIPKWGGLAEIAQVGCRAGAVGGGVYVLGKGLQKVRTVDSTEETGQNQNVQAELTEAVKVSSSWLASSLDNMPATSLTKEIRSNAPSKQALSRSIFIISSTLSTLLPTLSADASGPRPAAAVVVYPSSTMMAFSDVPGENPPPVHILVHSSDAGECPEGQCILYASTRTVGETGRGTIKRVVDNLLQVVQVQPAPKILWTMEYEQHAAINLSTSPSAGSSMYLDKSILLFPDTSLDLALDDEIISNVKSAWDAVVGPGQENFMTFPVREGEEDE